MCINQKHIDILSFIHSLSETDIVRTDEENNEQHSFRFSTSICGIFWIWIFSNL